MPIPVSRVRRSDTHRFIQSKYSPKEDSVLTRIGNDAQHLAHIFDFDNATNDRLLAERDLLPGISAQELVTGIPYASVINAAFTHAHPQGSRFAGPDRGAWYAAFEARTSQAEVAFHKTVQLAEINRFVDDVTYDDYCADFGCDLHDLRNAPDHAACFDPNSYVASQTISAELLQSGSHGIVYPSVRRPKGTCICCFRPALVTNVRKGPTYRFVWDGTPAPTITKL